jgi:phenylacetate-CoA ligase
MSVMTSIDKARLGSTEAVLAAFRRAASESPAYRTLLEEQGVSAGEVVDLVSFMHRAPLLSKDNTFGRFPMHELVTPGVVDQLSSVLTSSGHGGQFSFGIGTRRQAAGVAPWFDDALDAAFQVKSRRTLAINCLPMGVGIASDCMAVATVSVREDMAVALVKTFGQYFDQVLIISDPLFLPCLLAHAEAQGVDWTRYAVKVVIGEEFFGEHFRGYVGMRLGYSPQALKDGVIRSSFGTAELGLHLLYETPTTIALRRAAVADRSLASALWGNVPDTSPVPMLLTFDAGRVFVEVDDPDADGFGALTVTTLDAQVPIPLPRYQPGDLAALLDYDSVSTLALGCELQPLDVPHHLVALRGRRKELMPNGCHVGIYREAIFASPEVASFLTGALRVQVEDDAMTLHVQLMLGRSDNGTVAEAVANAVATSCRPAQVRLWSYETFPFGMGLDYERKFRYYDPATSMDPS